MRNVAGLLAAAIMSTGCSWAFMTRPPSMVAAPNRPVHCTSSVAAPVLDTICASYFILNGVALAAGNYNSSTQSSGIALSAGLTLLCGISAATGYGSASRCEHVQDENALCMTGDNAACTELRADWKPAAAPAPPGAFDPAVGCAKDADCKGDRICERGACVNPGPVSSPQVPAPPPPPAGQ